MARKNTEKSTETSKTNAKKAPSRLQGEIKQQMKRRVTAVLVSTVALFFVVFVPSVVVDPIADSLKEWQRFLLKLGISFPIMIFVPWIIFAQDQLATGASRASEFFRHHYPSTLAVRKYSMSRQEADRTWFEYFNPWEDPKHRWHSDYKNTFERGYSLRLIYYLHRFLLLFVIAASAATVLTTFLLGESRPVIASKVGVILIVALLWWWLHASNTFTKLDNGEYSATGAYLKYQEINGITSNRFETEVLAKRKTAAKATAMAEDPMATPSTEDTT